MTAQKEEWVQVGLWRHYRSHTSSLQSLEEDLTFFKSVVYDTKSQETQNKILLQQLKTQSINSGFYVTLSNLDPFFLLQIKKFFCISER